MKRFLRLLLAVVLGFVVGSVVNMGLLQWGGALVPPPAGADVTTMEGLKAALPHFEPRHFLFPFLAHALGTLVGAFAATLAAPQRASGPGSVVGGLFLLGGLASAFLLGGPGWFIAVDLLLAYAPTAWAGIALGRRVGGVRRLS